MSGVQVNHSPAVASQATHLHVISSWKDADLSALTASQKKSYYRRKSAIKDYFTTEESLSQIASRYHLPVKMLEKLAKRCTMRHEDGALWGYRALVPGITVIDHTPKPSSDSELSPTPASSNDAVSADGDDRVDTDGGAHTGDEADDNGGTDTGGKAADGDESDAYGEVDNNGGTDIIGEADAEDGANVDEEVNTGGEAGADGEADTGGEANDECEAGADSEADTESEVNIVGEADVNGEADAIKRVPTEPIGDNDSAGTRLMASATLATAAPASGDDTLDNDGADANGTNDASPAAGTDNAEAGDNSDITREEIAGVEEADEDTEAEEDADWKYAENNEGLSVGVRVNGRARVDDVDGNDGRRKRPHHPSIQPPPLQDEPDDKVDEDTAPRRAIVLPRQDPGPADVDDIPDFMGIEEMSTGKLVDGHVEVEAPAPLHTPLPEVSEGDSGEFFMPEGLRRRERSLVVYQRLLPAALPRTSKKHIAVAGIDKRTIITKRSIRRRWIRSVERTRKRMAYRWIGLAVAAVILLSLLIPLGAGIAAYSAYNSIKGIALDGVSHLLDVKTLMPASKSDFTALLNPAKLQQASADLTQAQSDFLQLQQLINRQDIQSMVQQFAPQYSDKLGMAQRLLRVGVDVTRMGNELIGVAMLGANILHSSPLASGSTKPLITVDDVSKIEGTMLHALYYIQDMKAQMSQVSLSQLPLSAAQQKEITSAMALLPKAQNYIEQGQGLVGIVSWLLGVGHARRFLVQTMDQAELRPGGGFTGQYGVFTVQDGRLAPFTLQDVTELDYNGNGAELGRQPPPAYPWMNFGNFGLRDANLSGDFPTTARLVMQVFQEEGGGPVDGDIAFTPTAIEHVLDIIGPLKIPAYNETITAQNLEDKLHYYQNDPAAIALQREKTGTHNAATRKSFTALVGSTLLSTVRHLPISTLLKIVQNATKDIQSRDLEIYFTNPLAEGWLVTHSFSGAISTFSNVDGFMVVQANISISKASDDVKTTEQDNIVLDAQGGATHNLTITLDYEGTKPIYSVYTTYADYIRVYAPANAVLESGYGFDTGKALCTSPPVTTTDNPPNPNPGLPPCNQFTQSYSSNALYCPSGNYSLGPRGWMQGKGYSNWSLDDLGAPTELTSDLPGRAMWGGLTVTPKNCISTITLTWYVPNAVKHVVGQPLYAVLVQKQGGYVPQVQISIDTSQLQGVKPYSFNGAIYGDRLFSLPVVKKGK